MKKIKKQTDYSDFRKALFRPKSKIGELTDFNLATHKQFKTIKLESTGNPGKNKQSFWWNNNGEAQGYE